MAVKWSRWGDHLPVWVAWGATASTGQEPGDLLLMALPLLAALLVEGLRRDISGLHRWLEVGALLFFLGDLARGQGVLAVALHTLFLLAGLRLALPREITQRRQLLLISFLLFLATAIGTTDLLFLLWALLWAGVATMALLQQSWEASAGLRRGASTPPPYARVPLWIAAALVFGIGFFVIMPRLSLGLRGGLAFGALRGMGQAGLGEQLDLSTGGPIEPNPEVALRIEPSPGTHSAANPQWATGIELLRGITLESVHGLRWEPSDFTPPIRPYPAQTKWVRQADFLYTPSPHGILVLPTGVARWDPPELQVFRAPGTSLRWRFPRARTVPVTVYWSPQVAGTPEPQLYHQRLANLTRLEPEHEAARRASFRFAPGILPTPQLVLALETGLRGFAYTLDNPSGKAPNPLQDFLERSQAGHCEYFASAMALMLRARGIPARVVNGYRLGPWIPEGGYFRVSQNEAHSWVEYWSEGRWFTSDPTPTSSSLASAGASNMGVLGRWLDTLRFRWDRYVVRFSDQDQLGGLSWLQTQLQGWEWKWKAPPRQLSFLLATLALAWTLWRTRHLWRPVPEGPGRIRALAPLLARTRRTAPPLGGETARAWLLRLASLRPERHEALNRLAQAIDREAYGQERGEATSLASAEALAWRGWRPTSL